MIPGAFARLRSVWRGMRRRSAVEAEMSEEFRLHVELRAEDLARSGVPPDEAARRARLEFGSAERHKQEARVSRGLHYVDAFRFSWLDFKLGFRMLAKYPGLTVVGGLAMAFAVWAGAGTFELIGQWLFPRLPLPDGDRIVGIQLWHTTSRLPDPRALHDFAAWREELESVEDVSAFRTVDRNLFVSEGRGQPVEVAEITASALRVARVRPQLGRILVESDELTGAAPVIVVGHEVWQTRLDGAPDVIGQTIHLGNVEATIVGVMPEGFAFPISHQAWMPLRLNALNYEPLEGPGIRVLGRLARGVTLDQAQTELDYLGQRAAADFPDTHAHLRPRIMPYAQSILTELVAASESAALPWANFFIVMLIVLVCGNVGLLMLARAATRESEIVVRSALGASRGRIVMQLLAEASVLAAISAIVGLATTGPGLRFAMFFIEGNLGRGRLPFWMDDSLSPTTLLYAGGLTVLGAVIAGVLPALRVTRSVGTGLRQATAGGGGLKFSGLWTIVIVAQVAVTVAFPVSTFSLLRLYGQIRSYDVGFADELYASVRLELDSQDALGMPVDASPAAFLARFHRAYRELEHRLSAEPAVEGVAFADRLPRMNHWQRQIDVIDGAPASRDSVLGPRVNTASVDVDYFDVLGAPILSGRGFNASDLETSHRVVIVNQSFVDQVLRGRNPLGRRLRFREYRIVRQRSPLEPGPWYEVIGVAPDLGMGYRGSPSGDGAPGLYLPLVREEYPLYMAVRVRGDPASFGPRMRAAAYAVDPMLRLHDFQPLDQLHHGEQTAIANLLRISLLTSSIALLLSLTGIYSVTSFAVSRRTREIGIRVALGASRVRIMLAIFSRPVGQVAVGIIAGAGLVGALVRRFTGGLSPHEVGIVIAYAALMTAVCMLACVVPARRALAVEPTEALSAGE